MQRIELQPDAAHEVGARDWIGVGVEALVAHRLNGNVSATDRAMPARVAYAPLRERSGGLARGFAKNELRTGIVYTWHSFLRWNVKPELHRPLTIVQRYLVTQLAHVGAWFRHTNDFPTS